MNEELLHDAIGQIGEGLTVPVDALRRRRKFPWAGLCAAAACLCIVIGLAYPGFSARNDSQQEMMQDEHMTEAKNSHTVCLQATVVEVYDSYLVVSTQTAESGSTAADSMSTAYSAIEVSLPEGAEDFSAGDQVEIFYDGIMLERYPPVIPTVYKIEKVR